MMDLDHALGGGLWTGNLTIVAARPSMGKTAFALNILANVGRAGWSGVFASYEMSADQIARRLIQIVSRADPQEIVDAYAAAPESTEAVEGWQRLVKGTETLMGLPVGVYDGKRQTIEEVAAMMSRAKRDKGARLLILDYQQQMAHSPLGRGVSKSDHLGHIAREAKALAKDLDVHVILLSQVNRGLESRQDKRPLLSDLRGSGETEEAADNVLTLYRHVYYEITKRNAARASGADPIDEDHESLSGLRRRAEIGIVKRRAGVGAGKIVPVRWFREFQRFEDAAASWR
jgi:replicative DNA helicase